MKMYSWPYQLKKKLLCYSLWTGMEKREFFGSTCEYHVLESVSICSSNETTSGSAAVTGVTPWFKFTIIHYHFPRSFCPLHRPNKLAA